MDTINTQIIQMLSLNARTPLLQIAKQIDLSESAVRKRVKKLEEDGVIQKYSLSIDHTKLGYGYTALVGVDAMPEMYFDVSQKLRELEDVQYVAASAGDHMFMLKILAQNNSQLQKICDQIRHIHGVTRICPAILQETIKGTL